MSNVIADALSGIESDSLRHSIVQELQNGALKQCVAAETEKVKYAQANHKVNWKSVDGLGRLRMRVTPEHYHFWGQKFGYKCWKDTEFLNDVEKWNPELKVKCGGTKLQVGYGTPSGFTAAPAGKQPAPKRFTQTYDLK